MQSLHKLYSTTHGQRLVSGSILALLCYILTTYWVSYLLPSVYIMAFVTAYEWIGLVKGSEKIVPWVKYTYSSAIVSLLLLPVEFYSTSTNAVILVVLLMSIHMLLYRNFFWSAGAVLHLTAWHYSLWLIQNDINSLSYMVSMTALADIMGYYVGKKAITKQRPWPWLSPKKTYEGTLAMVITPSIVSLVIPGRKASLSMFIGVFALLGDLLVSYAKRLVNRKDTGSIIPAHGGVLDRIDSHLMVLAVIAFSG